MKLYQIKQKSLIMLNPPSKTDFLNGFRFYSSFENSNIKFEVIWIDDHKTAVKIRHAFFEWSIRTYGCFFCDSSCKTVIFVFDCSSLCDAAFWRSFDFMLWRLPLLIELVDDPFDLKIFVLHVKYNVTWTKKVFSWYFRMWYKYCFYPLLCDTFWYLCDQVLSNDYKLCYIAFVKYIGC